MKQFILLLATLGTLSALSMSCRDKTTEQPEAIVTDTVPPLFMQIQKTSRLYTTEYHIHKIVTHDDVVRLKGNLLKQDFDIPSEFSEKNIERNGKHITILLPDPKVTLTSSKINQKEIKRYVGLTRSHFTDKELTSYEQQGRKAILDNIPNMDILPTAQANATRVLVPMLTQMGYKEEDITIAFRKNLSIKQLINSSLGMARSRSNPNKGCY